MSLLHITHAMIMAAGLGKRMLPLTLTVPKPLVEVGGQPMIERAVARLRADGVGHAVVNVHHLAHQVEAWARGIVMPEIIISDERDCLLETGGGLVKALPLLGKSAFFVLNSDSFWSEGATPALQRLREAWRDEAMDCLLLLAGHDQIIGDDSGSDFTVDSDGRLLRAAKADPGGFVYVGAYIVHPRLFKDAPRGCFSMNVLWDRALAEGRLFGLVHDGVSFLVGTPQAAAAAEAWSDMRPGARSGARSGAGLD